MDFDRLTACFSDDKSSFIVKKILKENPDLCIVPVDKSKNILIINRIEYIKKLEAVFSDETKFRKLKENPLADDLVNFRALLKTLEPYLSKRTRYNIAPMDNIKSSYGIIKLHKLNAPVRPIITSYGAVTSNAESFLVNLIKPIRNICTFSVKTPPSSKKIS